MSLGTEPDAFHTEHRRSGDLDGGIDADRVWMTRASAQEYEAQQAGKVSRLGMLWNTPTPPMEDVVRQGLRELTSTRPDDPSASR